MERDKIIRINRLRFGYRVGEFQLAVDDLCVKAHERVAITGPSGSGKTTLLNLLAGILTPDSGEVEVEDTVVSTLVRLKQTIKIRLELIEYTEAFQNCKTECEQWDDREQSSVDQAHCAHRELPGKEVAQHRVQVAQHSRNDIAERARFRQWFPMCEGCGTRLAPKPGDCCVFCSYGTVRCPPIQADAGYGCGE